MGVTTYRLGLFPGKMDENLRNAFFGDMLLSPARCKTPWRRDEHWEYVLEVFTQIGVGYAYNSCSDYGGYFTVDLSQ